jgi:hypothetical protein
MKHALSDEELLNLTEEQAADLLRQGDETVIWALLRLVALAKNNISLTPALSTPSSQIPPYQKPAAKKGRKKRGRPEGHEGSRRAAPIVIDRREEHALDRCPECGGPLGPAIDERRRIIEDIEKTRPVTTEHTIHSHWCPKCRKRVEPRVTDALPKSTIGNRALVLGSWFHYGLGQTTSQVAQLFDSVFHFPVSASGLVQQWMRLADILLPWYEQIAQEARESAVLNVDETGWRVNGKTHWLWCFTSPTLTLYDIDPSRSSEVLSRVLAECFEGTLVSDFYGAYNIIASDRQLCLAHLLREIEKVSETNASEEWKAFGATLKRLVKDAIRLSRRADREALVDLAEDEETTSDEENVDPSLYRRRVNRIHLRLDQLISHSNWNDADCARLAKRLEKYRYSLFTFLDDPSVPFDNNRAEREIRPAVIARKNSFHNTSERGATTQAVLMSIYRTLKLRGLDPVETLADALTLFIATGKLSALPDKSPG